MKGVANVFMGDNIQVGTITIEQHKEIIKAVRSDWRLYGSQIFNIIGAMIKTFLRVFRDLVMLVLLFVVIGYLIGEPTLLSIFEGTYDMAMLGSTPVYDRLMLFQFKATYIALYVTLSIMIKASLFYAFVLSLVSISITYLNILSSAEPSSKTMGACQAFIKNKLRLNGVNRVLTPKFIDSINFIGYKDCFFEKVDSKIKKILQEQSMGHVFVEYNEKV